MIVTSATSELGAQPGAPPHEHPSVATLSGSSLGRHNPSNPRAPSTAVPNERHRPEAVFSVTDAKKHDRNGEGPGCSCSGRNLVVCIDGTANQFSEKNSNVVELYSRLVKNREQLTYYNSGIGTYVKDSKSWKSWFSLRAWKQGFDHTLDEAVAWNFKQRVLSAYQWLSENYEDGDRIFLFGFSRGAYQIRVIAGMIELLTDDVANEKRDRPKDLDKPLCAHFKETLSRPSVKVHFVGAWDTVSSVGIFRGRNLPETTTGMEHVCIFRHALALDELRVKFLPEYANGGAGPKSCAKNIKEVWFAGSHSDIGGGNILNPGRNLFGPALRWMSYEAISCGLKMQPHRGEWSPITPNESMTSCWKILEYIPIPISRLSYQNMDSTEWWPPHCEGPRKVQNRQLIHQSVVEGMAKGYKPKARIYDEKIVWNVDSLKNVIENDPYAQADDVLSRLRQPDWATSEVSDADVDVLGTLASSEIGQRSIIAVRQAPEILIASLYAGSQRLAGTSELRAQQSLISIIGAMHAFHLSPPAVRGDVTIKLRKFVSSLGTRSPEIQKDALKLMCSLGANFFALVIGIDEYQDPDIVNLTGCVADADDIVAFLTDSVGVPTDNIINLRNGQATRMNIISNLVELARNDRIPRDAAMLIYYAGYGSQMMAPSWWGTIGWGTMVQLLIPSDLTPERSSQGSSWGIPDRTFAALLADIADNKGNNITVILDCCWQLPERATHTPNVRAICLPSHYGMPRDLDSDLYGRNDIILENLRLSSASHVLLVACSQYQQAYEINGRGAFTQVLTSFLRTVPIDTITYRDIIDNLQRLPYQDPQCEGASDMCILFHNRTNDCDRDMWTREIHYNSR